MVWLAAWFWVNAAVAGECPAPMDTATLGVALERAERAFADLDADAFTKSADDAAFGLPCVSSVATSALAARYHRLTALRWFLAGDEASSLAALAAAYKAEPTYVFPEDLVPQGHALRALYTRAQTAPDDREPVPKPRDAELFADGAPLQERPTARPAWVQLVNQGRVETSVYLLPSDPLPAYDAVPLPRAATAQRSGGGWAVGAGASLVASGVLYGAAMSSKHGFMQEHPSYSLDDLRQHRSRTNALAGASAGTLGLAVAFGVGFVAVL